VNLDEGQIAVANIYQERFNLGDLQPTPPVYTFELWSSARSEDAPENLQHREESVT
jgi:hypothetical protein